MTADELAIVRRAYAKQILATAGVEDGGLEAAFAAVPREDFLGPGPWSILRREGYRTTPSADPVYLYTDDLVAIVAERGLNNGQPSFLALLVNHVAPRRGDHIVHVGAGVGYYTAILAEMVGPDGRVTAIEVDPGLAARARRNLAGYGHVTVVAGDGAAVAFEPADAILVNAGVTRPADLWLDRLRDGGRLVLPLTVSKGSVWGATAGGGTGAVFLVTRRGETLAARRISGVGIFHSPSLRDDASEQALRDALEHGDGSAVTRLHRRDDFPEEICWLRGRGWGLTTEASGRTLEAEDAVGREIVEPAGLGRVRSAEGDEAGRQVLGGP